MFEFDPAKSEANCAKHGIDFVEAQALWDDERRILLPTYPGHDGELRWIVIGQVDDRLWTAVFAERGEAIRIISVRRARDKEGRVYHGQDD